MPSIVRALSEPAFWIVLAVAICGLADVPWIAAVPLGVAGLQGLAMPKFIAAWPRARAMGAAWEWWSIVAQSTAIAFAAVGACYLLGYAVALALG